MTPDQRLAEAVRKLRAREQELEQQRDQLLQQRAELLAAADAGTHTNQPRKGDS